MKTKTNAAKEPKKVSKSTELLGQTVFFRIGNWRWAIDVPSAEWERIRRISLKQKSAIRHRARAVRQNRPALEIAEALETALAALRVQTPTAAKGSMAEAFFPFSDWPEAPDRVIQLLAYEEFRDLRHPWVSKLLENACRQSIRGNRPEFFRKLGRSLERRPKKVGTKKQKLGLHGILMENWVSDDENSVQLCWFSIAALAEFFSKILGRPVAAETLRAQRRRLKLLKLTPAPIRSPLALKIHPPTATTLDKVPAH